MSHEAQKSPARLAIFYATVGTGHRSAAEALRDWHAAENPEAQLLCRDLLDYTPRFVRTCVRGAYLFMARRSPWTWGRMYDITDRPVRAGIGARFWHLLHRAVSRLYLRRLLREIDEFQPDAILATHFFGMSSLLDVWMGAVPICFVGTDYIGHALQRDPRFDVFFVASSESLRQHRADGILNSGDTVKNYGIPVAPAYADPPSRELSRSRLGIDESTVHVVIAGGGIGAGAIENAADSMLKFTRTEEWRIDILCGNNRRLRERLRDKYHPFTRVFVHGFIDNIIDYYVSCDVLILKPGGLSTAEAAACGAAILLLEPLPGQEQRNSDYLLENGAASRLHETRMAGERIRELLDSPDILETLRINARSLSRPCAARDILLNVEHAVALAAENEAETEETPQAAAEAPGVFEEESGEAVGEESVGGVNVELPAEKRETRKGAEICREMAMPLTEWLKKQLRKKQDVEPATDTGKMDDPANQWEETPEIEQPEDLGMPDEDMALAEDAPKLSVADILRQVEELARLESSPQQDDEPPKMPGEREMRRARRIMAREILRKVEEKSMRATSVQGTPQEISRAETAPDTPESESALETTSGVHEAWAPDSEDQGIEETAEIGSLEEALETAAADDITGEAGGREPADSILETAAANDIADGPGERKPADSTLETAAVDDIADEAGESKPAGSAAGEKPLPEWRQQARKKRVAIQRGALAKSARRRGGAAPK